MSKLEKWVVLGVLALIVGILVVSLTVDDPLEKDSVVMASSERTDAVSPASAPARSAPSALLNSSVAVEPPAAAAPEAAPAVDAPAIPPGSILKTSAGLQDSYMPDAKFYTWQAGDTFPALAQRFYGDAARLATLRRLNEGRADAQPGDRILVPVYDLDAAQPAAAPSSVAAAPASAPAAENSPALAAAAAKVVAVPLAGARSHVVQEGESLWRIARKELGSGARWNEIYEANRDVLSSPEALHTGQKLRIP